MMKMPTFQKSASYCKLGAAYSDLSCPCDSVQILLILSQFQTLKADIHGQVHARADWLKNKLHGSTLNSMRACGGTIC